MDAHAHHPDRLELYESAGRSRRHVYARRQPTAGDTVKYPKCFTTPCFAFDDAFEH